MTRFEIIDADALDDLAALEPVAEAVFGPGDRRPGWFARKLIREGVDPRLSSLVVDASADAVGPGEVLGYALLGRAPSLADVARGAGVGVLAPLRRRGLGRRLIEGVSARAHAAGCEAVEFLAEPDRLAWYLDQGFAIVEEQLTLLAAGTGEPNAALPEQTPREPDPTAIPLWSWIPEFWSRTPAVDRTFVELDAGRFWLTREGRAWLVHRCELAPGAHVSGLEALRRKLPRNTPLLLYPCPATSAWVGTMCEAGFAPAQRSFVVRRETKASG